MHFRSPSNSIFTIIIVTVSTFTGYILGIQALKVNYLELENIHNCVEDYPHDSSKRLKCYDEYTERLHEFLNNH